MMPIFLQHFEAPSLLELLEHHGQNGACFVQTKFTNLQHKNCLYGVSVCRRDIIGQDIVFRFIIECSSLRDFGP
jgi:hypothetical protein